MIAYKILVDLSPSRLVHCEAKVLKARRKSVSAYRLRSYHEKMGENTERKIMQWLAFVRGSQVGLVRSQDLPLCRVGETFRLPSWSISHCDWKVIGSLPFVNILNPPLAAGSFGSKEYHFALT